MCTYPGVRMGTSPFFEGFTIKRRPFQYLADSDQRFQSTWCRGQCMLQRLTCLLLLDQRKLRAKDDGLEKASGNVSLFFFFFFFHGQKVGCFSDQANKHLWSPCTVCKAWCGGLQTWARQGVWLQGASRPGEVIKLIASFNRWGLFPWGLRQGLFIFLVTAT